MAWVNEGVCLPEGPYAGRGTLTPRATQLMWHSEGKCPQRWVSLHGCGARGSSEAGLGGH